MSRMPPWLQGHGAMLLFSLLVAGSFSLGGMVANHIDPTVLNALRFALAAGILGGVVAAGPGFRRADFRAPWRYLLLGGIFAFYFVLMFEGLKTAPPVSAAAVFTLTPLMTAGFGLVLLGQAVGGRLVLALAIGGLGALWVIFRGDPAALMAFEVGRGEAIYFVGCIAHAIFTPLLRLFNRGEPAAVSTFAMLVGGGILLFAFGAPALLETDFTTLPLKVWVALAYLALFASAATFFLLQFATLRLPSAKVMAYTYLTPSWVILWEIGLGNGTPPAVVLAGLGATLVALLMLLREDGPAPAPRGLKPGE